MDADRQICTDGAESQVQVSGRRYGCDVGFKGPLPDLPKPQPGRQRRILDPAEIEAVLLPAVRAQQPLEDAADRIQLLVHDAKYGGFASVALERDPPSVILLWKGPLPQPVQDLIDELPPTDPCRGT